MNKWLEILIGLIFVVVAVYAWGMNFWGFGAAAVSFFKGGLIWMILGIGLIFLLLGISDLKD